MQVIRAAERPFVPAGHENPDDPGVWKRVLVTKPDLQPGQVQMVNWARMPGRRAFDAHYHEDMQELFVIITGRAELRVGEEHVTLQAGDAVLIDAGEVHRMWNPGTSDVDYLALGISGGEHGRTVVVDEAP